MSAPSLSLVETRPRHAPHATLPVVTPTPLVEIVHPRIPSTTRLFAKLESVHPGGSIKDRPVSRIIQQALAAGHVVASGPGRASRDSAASSASAASGRRLLDSSSGNAGIAYAMIGARYGVPVTLVVPANASRERLSRIRAHGAELLLTDPMEGYDETIRQARRLAREQPEKYWYANQYGNENNWRAHYETTGGEILEQVAEATGTLADGTLPGATVPDAFVAGVGTGGTFTGVGRRLRAESPGVFLATVVPDVFPGIEGLKPLGAVGDIVPEILDESIIDQRLDVRMEEAVELCHWLSRQGLFVGPSSGANLEGALRLAEEGRFETVVTTFNDTGERYLSTGMWGESPSFAAS